MNLDMILTQIGLRMRNLVVVDLSFPVSGLHEFKSAYEDRFLHLPGRHTAALEVAAGIASQGKVVLLVGSQLEEPELLDQTLNVKLARRSDKAVWDYIEDKLMEFGPSVILIPNDL